jgi:hypothetical protein
MSVDNTSIEWPPPRDEDSSYVRDLCSGVPARGESNSELHARELPKVR